MTDEQLRAIVPGVPPGKCAQLLPCLQAALTEFAIDTPARKAAFVAQLAHESGQFRFMEEIWGPTDAQRRYEPRSPLATRLGNTEPGDGRRFKGRGPIQITGRANYTRFGGLLGVDLVAEPERAALPGLAFRIAGLFWDKKGLNALADRATAEAFREITRRINGGFNGLADRERFYAVARATLGVVTPSLSRGGGGPSTVIPPEPDFERGHEAVRSDVIEAPTENVDVPSRSTSPRRRTAPRRSASQPRKKVATRKSAGPRTRATTPKASAAPGKTATRAVRPGKSARQRSKARRPVSRGRKR